ncbi:hypothetical protein [Kitasatospora purpeofusca]|uniref:hypothetical protein n=1 Tax=Kitasatospora purpeofusca TaxID=67352 RepID=UPI002A599CF7|nr:hypothetical protein [Kitasatospora purpeofusca]MDY0810601.1 hypothetical protein [Kitasatospora purpeofusca]
MLRRIAAAVRPAIGAPARNGVSQMAGSLHSTATGAARVPSDLAMITGSLAPAAMTCSTAAVTRAVIISSTSAAKRSLVPSSHSTGYMKAPRRALASRLNIGIDVPGP